jgi:8-oxo-dGTP pyrophosphatase MutT (NUDIX family)
MQQYPIPVVCAVIKQEDRFFLQKRNEPQLPEAHEKWEFPGGKIELNELPNF